MRSTLRVSPLRFISPECPSTERTQTHDAFQMPTARLVAMTDRHGTRREHAFCGEPRAEVGRAATRSEEQEAHAPIRAHQAQRNSARTIDEGREAYRVLD